MVNVFFSGHHCLQWFFNGFDNVGPSPLNVFEGPTIGVNGFSMVFKILRAMVNDAFEVNDGLDVPLHLKSA